MLLVVLRHIRLGRILSAHTFLREKSIMAVRKKSETIHLRVSPISKALLESLASLNHKTSTQIIEDLIAESAEKTILSEFRVDSYINRAAFENKTIDLKTLISAVQHPTEPVITKFRLYFIAPNALSSRDYVVYNTILLCSELFKGNTKIFESVENLMLKEFIGEVPDVDLAKINAHMESLDGFAAFKEKNPNLKSTYKIFLEMTGAGL
jgi:uncharacterized protein (DUF1778 family)